MEFSFLIVTKNRPEDLEITLTKIFAQINLSVHEVLVFIDGCSVTEPLIPKYPWVKWHFTKQSIGASPARAKLYTNAIGNFFVGLDDDAHIISSESLSKIKTLFSGNPTLGIIAFQEVKGIFDSDAIALEHSISGEDSYFTSDFIGCGFAISKEVYLGTRGFPEWIDIYGEESCVAIEVLDNGFEILYHNGIIVNHRVDRAKRQSAGRNYFRFEKQLKNTMYYYIVYYKYPLMKAAKLLIHNFRKYALQDSRYFGCFLKACCTVLVCFLKILRHRQPVSRNTLQKIKTLKGIKY